jgi:hypothetical protein
MLLVLHPQLPVTVGQGTWLMQPVNHCHLSAIAVGCDIPGTRLAAMPAHTATIPNSNASTIVRRDFTVDRLMTQASPRARSSSIRTAPVENTRR